jgi:hypothetical protein
MRLRPRRAITTPRGRVKIPSPPSNPDFEAETRPVAVAHGRNDPIATNAPPTRITAAVMLRPPWLTVRDGAEGAMATPHLEQKVLPGVTDAPHLEQ